MPSKPRRQHRRTRVVFEIALSLCGGGCDAKWLPFPPEPCGSLLFCPALTGRSCAMRNTKKGVLVVGLTVAALCAPVNSSFGQAHTRMSGPPQPPKATTTPTGTWLPKSIAYIKASNAGKDNQFGYAIALSANGNTLAVSAIAEDSGAKGVSKDRAI